MNTKQIIEEIEKVTGEKYTGQGEAISQDFINMLVKLINMVKEK